MKKIVMLVMTLWFAVAVAAHAGAPIKIGVYLPLSGSNEAGGRAELNGILLAHQQQPRLLGRDVQLVILDNASNPVEAAKAVSQLAGENVVAILGSYGSSESIAGGEVAERARIPMLGTSCSNPLITQGRHYTFRLSFADGTQAEVLARHAVQSLNSRKAVILSSPDSDYSVGLAAYFKRTFSEAGGKVLENIHFKTGDKDFSSQIATLMETKPDAVFFSGYALEGAYLLKQLGAHPPFHILCGDSMNNPDLLSLPNGTEDKLVHTTFPYNPAQGSTFTGQWKTAYPTMPPSANGAVGYTAYALLADAIRRAGQPDTEAITKALGQTANFPSPLGRLSMDLFHNADTRVGVAEYRNGKMNIKVY